MMNFWSSELYIAVTASFWFLIPLIIGLPLLIILKKFTGKNIGVIGDATLSFINGNIILFLQTAVVSSLYPQNITHPLQFITKLELALGILVGVWYLINNHSFFKPKKEDIISGVIIILVSILGYALWSVNNSPGAILNWDMFMHQSAVFSIKDGLFNLNTKLMSDTFKFYSYTPMFHTSILGAQLFIENLDIGKFWWYAQYYHYLWTIAASFMITKTVTKSNFAGLISAILGAFVFESIMAYTSLILIPQTVIATALIFYLAKLEQSFEANARLWNLQTLFVILFFLLGHFIVGSAAVVIILFCILYLHLHKNSENFRKIDPLVFLTAALLSIPIFYLVTKGVDLSGMNRSEAAAFSPTLLQKFEYSQVFYGSMALIFFPVGILFVAKNKQKTWLVLASILALVTLAVVVTNIPYIVKLYTLGRYFVQVIITYGIWILLREASKKQKSLFLLFLGALMVPIFTINTYNFKKNLMYDGVASHVKAEELRAADFLRERTGLYGNKTLLISDPTSMHIFEGLTGINTPGGAFTDLETRKLVSKIFTSRDSEKMKEQILSAQDKVSKVQVDKIILVISGRFSAWQKLSINQKLGVVQNIWQPRDLTYTDYEFIEFLENKAEFKPVYKTAGIAIYEINR